MEKEIKIRPLTRKDRRVVSAMILKMTSKIGNTGLLEIISADASEEPKAPEAAGKTDKSLVMGLEIIKLLLATLEDDISVWFADLVGVTVEEFDRMPLDVEIQIIKQLKAAKEISDFFSGASQLFSGIDGFRNMLRGVNER